MPTKEVKKLSVRKINKYISYLQTGKELKPIKVAMVGNKLFIVDGHEKFIAGIMANKLVAKQLVHTKKIVTLNENQLEEWNNLINQSL